VRNTLHVGTITDTLTICENTQNPNEKSTEMFAQDLEQLRPYLIVERQTCQALTKLKEPTPKTSCVRREYYGF
jgi:hypothetical protein